jgi:hypothetical protein
VKGNSKPIATTFDAVFCAYSAEMKLCISISAHGVGVLRGSASKYS